MYDYKKRDGKPLAWLVVRNILRHALAQARAKFCPESAAASSASAKDFFLGTVLDGTKRVTWWHKLLWNTRDACFVRAVAEDTVLVKHAPALGTAQIKELSCALVRANNGDSAAFNLLHIGTWISCGRAGELALFKFKRLSMNYALSPTGTPTMPHLQPKTMKVKEVPLLFANENRGLCFPWALGYHMLYNQHRLVPRNDGRIGAIFPTINTADGAAARNLTSFLLKWTNTPDNIKLRPDILRMGVQLPGACSGGSYRHGAITMLKSNGIALPYVAALSGHSEEAKSAAHDYDELESDPTRPLLGAFTLSARIFLLFAIFSLSHPFPYPRPPFRSRHGAVRLSRATAPWPAAASAARAHAERGARPHCTHRREGHRGPHGQSVFHRGRLHALVCTRAARLARG